VRLGRPEPARRRARPAVLLVAVAALLALAAGACGTTVATPSPDQTSVPIGPTPWPSGTVGQYGLRIDPSLLKRLPIAVGGIALVEDAGTEAVEMDDPALPTKVDSLAAAMAGDVLDPNFLRVEVVRFKPMAQDADVYSQWIDDFAAGVCAQANGVGDSSQDTINGWFVDITTCNGGPIAYSLSLGDGEYLSMFDNGPKGLGRMLLSNLF
jgi:hypothetical protein